MRFQIVHRTEYRYDKRVHLEPFVVRVRPRCDRGQSVDEFKLEVDPAPSGLCELTDVDSNELAKFWFEGKTTGLVITAKVTARTLRENPFDYLVLDDARRAMPPGYSADESAALARYLKAPALDPAVKELVSAAGSQNLGLTDFLGALVAKMDEEFEWEIREEGDPMPVAETVAKRAGACRDLAVVFVECCREAGIAARFVSGYLAPDDPGAEQFMHAWAEVYLPDVGWRGYDPTHGVAVAAHHLAVAAAPDPAAAAPTDGTFRGSGATSQVHVDLKIQTT